MRLTSGSELMTLNKDRLETCSLSFLRAIDALKKVDWSGKSLEPQFSGGALRCPARRVRIMK